ncbi:UNVERIFIED_ORG: hypothetical protein EDC93_1011118 [Bacillus cereus]
MKTSKKEIILIVYLVKIKKKYWKVALSRNVNQYNFKNIEEVKHEKKIR